MPVTYTYHRNLADVVGAAQIFDTDANITVASASQIVLTVLGPDEQVAISVAVNGSGITYGGTPGEDDFGPTGGTITEFVLSANIDGEMLPVWTINGFSVDVAQIVAADDTVAPGHPGVSLWDLPVLQAALSLAPTDDVAQLTLALEEFEQNFSAESMSDTEIVLRAQNYSVVLSGTFVWSDDPLSVSGGGFNQIEIRDINDDVIWTSNASGPAALIQQSLDLGFPLVLGAAITGGSLHVGSDDDDNFVEISFELLGHDTIQAGDGDDQLNGGIGNDVLDGGAGNDMANYDIVIGTKGIIASIAQGTVEDPYGFTDVLIGIEDIRGTNFGDQIEGDNNGNILDGVGGDDTIQGLDGDDTVFGREGHDSLDGGAGNDQVVGGDGDDTMRGGDGHDIFYDDQGDDLAEGGSGGDHFNVGIGNDTIDGGANGVGGERDVINYYDTSSNSQNGVHVELTGVAEGTVTDFNGDTDSFVGIEEIRGTRNEDTFIGHSGNDRFRGFEGADIYDGGAGYDMVDLRHSGDAGADIDMSVDTSVDGAVTGTNGSGDEVILRNIERVRGTHNDDILRGSETAIRLEGSDGNDTIVGGSAEGNSLFGDDGNDNITSNGVDDYVEGGSGNDTITFAGEGGTANAGLGSDEIIGGHTGYFDLTYEGLTESVTIDTAAGETTLSGGDIDTFVNIRNVSGGEGNDTILGDDQEATQRFRSSAGDDHYDGRGGNDRLDFRADGETGVTVNFATGTASGSVAGNDTFANIESVRGSMAGDTFIGSDQEYTEYQGIGGVDSYTGGSGQDRLNFSADHARGGTGAVTVDLGAGTATDGFGNDETFTGIEQAMGTRHNDHLTGSDDDNKLYGLEGDDTLSGGAGDDWLRGGEGSDGLTGGAGADVFGGTIVELDGDTITDLSDLDQIDVLNDEGESIAANLTIVGDQLHIDIDGSGTPAAIMTIGNGFSGDITAAGGSIEPDPDPIPAVISVENDGLYSVVSEGDGQIEITLTRSGEIDVAVDVLVSIAGHGQNPIDGSDVGDSFPGVVVTFAPGETTQTFTLDIVDDPLIEENEDLVVRLVDALTTHEAGAEIVGDETFVRILNNDLPNQVSISGASVSESEDFLVFEVTLDQALDAELVVDVDLSAVSGVLGAEFSDFDIEGIEGLQNILVGGEDDFDPEDAFAASGTVSFAAGETSVQIRLPIEADTNFELHDRLIATLSQGQNVWPGGVEIGVRQAEGTVENDDGAPPVVFGDDDGGSQGPGFNVGSNWGDPHLVSLDGLSYAFQAVGEFTLIEAASGDPLNVQVRFGPVPGSDVASQTVAVVTQLGMATVVVDVEATNLVEVDGMAIDLNAINGSVSVGDGQLHYDGQSITLAFANGEQLKLDLFDGFMSTSVAILEGRDVRGLLGDGDGDSSNDLTLRDGTVLSQPVAFDDLYGAYADSWRLTDDSTMFTYPDGQGTADFTDLDFPLATPSIDDFPAEIVAEARAAAAGIEDPVLREAAVLDYLMSGNSDFIDATDQIDEITTDPVTNTAPDDAPALASGIGVLASDTSVVEGDSGTTAVTFTIYRTGDISEAVQVDYSFGGSLSTSEHDGVAGSITFAADGDRSAEVTVNINGDTLAEADETLELSFTTTGGSDTLSVLSSKATVTIVNDDGQEENLAPSGITLAEATVRENASMNTVIGALIVADPNINDTHTLEIVDNPQNLFALNGNNLVVAQDAEIDFETDGASQTVTIRATDADGLTVEQVLTITVTDLVETSVDDNGVTRTEGTADAEDIDAGDGDDLIIASGGDDSITMGDGADTVSGSLGDLLGDVLQDFSVEDEIIFAGSNLAAGDISLDAQGNLAVQGQAEALDIDNDLPEGEFLVSHIDGNTVVSFETYLPTLEEGGEVDEAMVNGIASQSFLTGDTGRSFSLELEGDMQGAGYSNAIGVYEVDGNGDIVNARMLVDNAKTHGAAAVTFAAADGNALGFFMVQDGADWAEALLGTDTLAFVDTADGNSAAQVTDGVNVRLAVNGTVADVTVFHSYDTALNVDGVQHVLSGVVAGENAMRIGFEDMTGGGDRDYQDLVFTVDEILV